jgi:hypothetical protein
LTRKPPRKHPGDAQDEDAGDGIKRVRNDRCEQLATEFSESSAEDRAHEECDAAVEGDAEDDDREDGQGGGSR